LDERFLFNYNPREDLEIGGRNNVNNNKNNSEK